MQTSMSSSTIRTIKDEFLEEYEPMPSLYWKKNKKPNIDIRVSPFALDRQLEDQKFSMIHNRNPRGFELTKGQKLRSESFVKRAEPSPVSTKAKVINKIVREVSGVHTYTLVPPIVKKGQREKQAVDPDTHPMMKPYRDESTRNPVMCSFGHRPSSASRTFHPSTMNFRLQHEEVAAVAGRGQSGFGLQPAVLAKLLHAPHLQGSEDDTNSTGSTRPPSGWEDPHDLFLPSASSATQSGLGSPSENAFNKSAASVSVSEGTASGPLGHGGILEHSKSWNTTSFAQSEQGDFNGSASFGQSSARKRRPKKSKKKKLDIHKDNRLDASGWNNHFQVIERNANENFELRKSGIAELKLMPLKERLTRYASLSVQDSRPEPFCTEKKHTDALLLSGFTGSTQDVFNKKENPYYDAEVDEDVRVIQVTHDLELEKKKKKLQRKKFIADLKTIPKCNYHPDQSVLNMHRMSDEELAMKKSENESQKEVGFQSVGDLYNTLSPPKKDKESAEDQKPRKAKGARKKGNPMQEKIRSFSHIYMEGDSSWDGSILEDGSSVNSEKKTYKPKYNIDKVFEHVMQPFDDYLKDDDEEEEEGGAEEKEEEMEKEEDEEAQQEPIGTDITEVLQQQEEEGKKRGFLDEEYDYNNMRDDDNFGHHDDDLRYNEDEDEQGVVEPPHEEREQEQDEDEDQDQDQEQEAVEKEEQEEEQQEAPVSSVGMEKDNEEDGGGHQGHEEDVEREVNPFVDQQYDGQGGDDQEQEDDHHEEGGGNKEEDEGRDDDPFVDQQYHEGDVDGDDDHDIEQDDHQQGHADDLLENPHVEQHQYEQEEEEDGGLNDDSADDYGYGGEYGHSHEDGTFEEGGEQEQHDQQEDNENYDDQNLDFANEELGDDGMFTEHQY